MKRGGQAENGTPIFAASYAAHAEALRAVSEKNRVFRCKSQTL